MPDLLRVAGLRAGYGEAIVIDDVGLALGEGRSLALLGRNGTGKTTLLATLVGVTRYRAGTIELARRPLVPLRPDQRAGAGLGPLRFTGIQGTDPGQFAVRQANLPLPGDWKLRVSARRGLKDRYSATMALPIKTAQ